MKLFSKPLKKIRVDIYAPMVRRQVEWHGDIHIGDSIYIRFHYRPMTEDEIVEKFGKNHRKVGSVENGAMFCPRTPILTVAEAEKVAKESILRHIPEGSSHLYEEPEVRVWDDYNQYLSFVRKSRRF